MVVTINGMIIEAVTIWLSIFAETCAVPSLSALKVVFARPLIVVFVNGLSVPSGGLSIVPNVVNIPLETCPYNGLW
jgi:hypothetical protein